MGFFMIFLWMIGHLFSVGLCTDNTRGFAGFAAALLLLFFWPLILGCVIREKMGWMES
jgi:Mn2+/Fe2+ NRAMP family transporter